MGQRTSIHLSTALGFLEGCRRRGIDPAAVLARVGVPGTLSSTGEDRFPVDRLGDLIGTIAHTLHDETLGFLDRPTPPGGLEMWIHSSITSRTLGEAVERWVRFWRLIHRDQHTEFNIAGEQACVTTEFLQDDALDRSSFITWQMFLMLRLASWLIGKALLLDRISFAFPQPADPGDYRDMFATRHYFGDRANSFVFNRRFLDMPVVQVPGNVAAFASQLPNLMGLRPFDQSLTARTRRMLEDADHPDALSIGCIARRLHRSEETLRRHLKSEGSSFSEIKESVRRDLAVYLLQHQDTPIGQVAYLTGFSEPSAFNRAFKRWTGRTPGDYRRRVA